MIRLTIPSMPPSSNHAYFNLPRGGRTLTTVGKKFKKETITHLVVSSQGELKKFKPNVPYMAAYLVYFEKLSSETWPEKAKNRFIRVDVSNRVKLLEDVIVEAAGIDDSQILASCAYKRVGSPEGVTAYFWNVDEEQSDLFHVLDRLQR